MNRLYVPSTFFIILLSIINITEGFASNMNKKHDVILEQFSKYSYVAECMKYDKSVEDVLLNSWNKTYSEYKYDSTQFYQTINSFYNSDTTMVFYLMNFALDTTYNEAFNHFSRFSGVLCSRAYFEEGVFYSQKNTAYLNLILNYYINKDRNSIKLLFDLVNTKVVVNIYERAEGGKFTAFTSINSTTAKELYAKMEMIFKQYGYSDRVKIKDAITEEFQPYLDPLYVSK